MPKDAHQLINELLVDIFDHILILEERYHRVHGVKLSMTEIHTLDKIHLSDTKMMSDVAAALRITQGTLTVTINRLNGKGYVNRVQDESDRRIYRLVLTEKALEVVRIHSQFHEEMTEGMARLIEDNDQLTDALAEINKFFKGLYEHY